MGQAMSADGLAVETEDLTKHYGPTVALEAANLEVRRGEVFGLVGPNGAGKTTLVKLLLNLVTPTRGRGSILGLDIVRDTVAVRRRVGYMSGEAKLYEHMRGGRLLDFVASLHGDCDGRLRAELVERLEVDLRHRIRTYSRGMKQKLALIAALLPTPDVLILDEPTNSLDPVMQSEFLEIIAGQRDRGASVLLCSHALHEVEQLCDRIAIINAGQIVAVGDLAALRRDLGLTIRVTFAGDVAPEELIGEGVTAAHRDGADVVLSVDGPLDAALASIARRGIKSLRVGEATLRDVYRRYVGGPGA
jgi:ABC-2 type transport system ATP-binding protein